MSPCWGANPTRYDKSADWLADRPGIYGFSCVISAKPAAYPVREHGLGSPTLRFALSVRRAAALGPSALVHVETALQNDAARLHDEDVTGAGVASLGCFPEGKMRLNRARG